MIINPSAFPWEWYEKIKDQTRKQGNQGTRNRRRYKDIITAFDIETTTIPEIRQSFMYIWQWQFGPDITVVGRTWREFQVFVKALEDHSKGSRIVAYVHNLSYEFQFLKGIHKFKPKDVFALQPRKVLKCDMRCIEFRCSYLHSGLNLDAYLKKMHVQDLKVEGFDYEKRRYPWTELSDEELHYCVNDVKGLVQAVTVDIGLEGDNLYTFPLTKTGYVRRDAKHVMRMVNHNYVPGIYPNYLCYRALREAFRGGNTHANRFYAGKILPEVSSADRSSSYPDTLCNCKFPVSRFYHIGPCTVDQMVDYVMVKERAVLMRVAFWDVKLSDPYWGCPYLTYDKSREIRNADLDNGRILRAEYLETTITDVDLRIILEEYDIETIEIKDLWYARYGKIPSILISLICQYYKGKTELKGVEGSENEYAKSKEKINSVYGMMVQDPGKAEIEFDGLLFNENKTNPEKTFYKFSRRAFLAYQWGVWCTAWARYRLEEGIRLAGDKFVYCDTDSVKYVGSIDWSAFNAARVADSKETGAFATDPKGKTHYMGVFESEGTYKRFVTLGAKKYAYEEQDGSLHVTCSGVVKDKFDSDGKLVAIGGGVELQKIENFKPGFVFRKAGGLDSVYNDVPEVTEWEAEGRTVKITSNVVLEPSLYTLGVTAEYAALLEDSIMPIDIA